MGTPTDELPPDESKKPVRIAIKLRPGESLEKFNGLPLLGLIKSLDEKGFGDLTERAKKLNPKLNPQKDLPAFSLWFQIITPSGVEPDELVAGLRKLKIVETAYAMRPVAPPTNLPSNPRNPNQGYLEPEPNGIDARYAWGLSALGIKGYDGAGIGFVDMERGWNLNHEDLPAGIIKISGDDYDQKAHGTSVLGIVLMADNPVGGLGIARGASCRVVSQWQPTGFNNPDAILSAIKSMAPGEVLLLEAQEFDPDRPRNYWPNNLWPAEIAPGTYEALEWAKALQIVVVEAAADGGNDLNQYTTNPTSGGGERIFDLAVRDSGAIMVGAGSSRYPHTPVATNTGNRVDCYAWGENIDTTSTNAAGTNNAAYRPDPVNRIPGFGGTSGAAAIVAGAALIVQGLARAVRGAPFSPEDLRQILKTNGTKSAGGVSDVIGVMPDLRAIITANRLGPAPVPPPPVPVPPV